LIIRQEKSKGEILAVFLLNLEMQRRMVDYMGNKRSLYLLEKELESK
jgi:hypothetical protein